MAYYWDSQIEYLMQTRALYFNQDYLEFLIERVWQIKEPINIIDFGCGFGYLGIKLLPLLPKGSTYTGVDKGTALLDKAKDIFSKLPYESKFICSDINDFSVEESMYDLAICQALLLHLPNASTALQLMIDSVKPTGIVVCIEPHRLSAMTNTYIEELKDQQIVSLGILQKLFEIDRKRTNIDGNIGLKIPTLMRALGLENIECRVSDKVNYLNSNDDETAKAKLFKSLESEGICPGFIEDEEGVIKKLHARGLSLEEAKTQVEIEKRLREELIDNGILYNILFAPTMMISYGEKTK